MRLSLAQAAEVRLGRQRAPQFEHGDNLVPYLRSANVTDGALNLTDVKQMNFTPAEQQIFGLQTGDVLVTEGSGSRDTVGASAVWRGEMESPVCFQNTLLRLRPRVALTDGRYLAWWIVHARASGQIAAISAGANILHIGSDGLKRLRITVPSLDDQRRIADFLDDRVARIDRIIAARREQLPLLREDFRTTLEHCVWGTRETTPLKHLLVDVTSGPRGWGDLVSEAGSTPFVRIGNLSPLGIELVHQNLVRVVLPDGAEAARATLAPDDVLLSITAAFGEVAVWREGGGAFSQHVARVRPKVKSDSDWIAWLLQTPSAHDQYRLQAYGGTKIGMGLDQVRNLAVPTLSATERLASVESAGHLWSTFTAGQSALKRSIDLLTAYKSSLITAAVTGELDVTTAGCGIPG